MFCCHFNLNFHLWSINLQMPKRERKIVMLILRIWWQLLRSEAFGNRSGYTAAKNVEDLILKLQRQLYDCLFCSKLFQAYNKPHGPGIKEAPEQPWPQQRKKLIVQYEDCLMNSRIRNDNATFFDFEYFSIWCPSNSTTLFPVVLQLF